MTKQLKMPSKGQSAAMMAALQAEHASGPPPEDSVATHVTTLQDANAPTKNVPNVRVNSTPKHSPATTPDPSDTPDTRDARLAFAHERAGADEVAVVTVRVPGVLNRYMDDYVARINRLEPRRKYRKQDAVLEAFAAFYADHPLPPAPSDDNLT